MLGWATAVILAVAVVTWATFVAAYATQASERERSCQVALIEAQTETLRRCRPVPEASDSHAHAHAHAHPHAHIPPAFSAEVAATVAAAAAAAATPTATATLEPSATPLQAVLAASPSLDLRDGGPDPDFRPRWTGFLGFFPNRTTSDPFQGGLYARAEEYGLELMNKQQMWNLTIGYEPAQHRKHFRYVFHLHWVAMVCTKDGEAEAFQELRSVLDFFQRIEDQGWYIVWTVHSVIDPSCTPEHHQLQIELLQTLADRADVIHLLCAHTIPLTAPYYVIPPEKVITVPQGSYVGLYSDVNLTQPLARRTLSLHTPFASDNDDLVLLYIGSVKRHRGLAQLVQAFNAVTSDMKKMQLWVVGELSTAERLRYSDAQWQQIQAAISVNPAIKTQYSHIHDDDLQFYYKAADAVVLPYPRDSVLSSGTLLTSLSFGRPVIAPPLSCMEEWLTDDVSIIFAPEEEMPPTSPSESTASSVASSTLSADQQPGSFVNSTTRSGDTNNRVCISLEEALRQASKLRADSYRTAAYEKALSYTYRDMSRLFFEKLKWRL